MTHITYILNEIKYLIKISDRMVVVGLYRNSNLYIIQEQCSHYWSIYRCKQKQSWKQLSKIKYLKHPNTWPYVQWPMAFSNLPQQKSFNFSINRMKFIYLQIMWIVYKTLAIWKSFFSQFIDIIIHFSFHLAQWSWINEIIIIWLCLRSHLSIRCFNYSLRLILNDYN